MGKLVPIYRYKLEIYAIYWQGLIHGNVLSSKMLDVLTQDNSISAIIKQTSLHYPQNFATLSLIFCYLIIKTWLHFWQDFVTYSITIITFVLHTFIEKYNCNRIFSALTQSLSDMFSLILITYRYVDINRKSLLCADQQSQYTRVL